MSLVSLSASIKTGKTTGCWNSHPPSSSSSYLPILQCMAPSEEAYIWTNVQESLSLKSTSTTAANASPTAAPNAVLCTDDHTFQLRQVHSSNSIFLLQPLEALSSLGSGSIPVPGVSAIAQCKATLELMPVATSAVQYLKESLPIYKDPLEGESSSTSEIGRAKSKLVVLEDAPMSTGEFESGWIELCAFETEGQAWRPLTSTLNGIWKSILSAVAVNVPKIDNGFPTFLISPLVQEDEYSESLLMAVLTRLSPNGDVPSNDCKLAVALCVQ